MLYFLYYACSSRQKLSISVLLIPTACFIVAIESILRTINVCRTNCIGESCILHSDCAPGESCCDATDKCATSCVGQSCTYNGDCATGECCDSDGKCDSGDCGLAGWIVAVIVISILVVVVIPIGVVVFCCFCAAGAAARRPARGGVIVTQPATTGNTTVIASQQQQQQVYPAQQGHPMYPQNPQPCAGQPPPYQPPYQPLGTMYPSAASYPPMAMTPQADVNQ